MTKIKEVARALFARAYKTPKALEMWQHISQTDKNIYIDLAHAAIEAMREPTEEMRQAAARGVSDSFHEEGFQEGDDPSLWNEFVKAGERALENAIDAALKEAP